MKCKLDKCRCNVLKIIILIILAIIIGTFIYKKRVQKVKKSTATIEQLKTAQVGNTVKVSYTGKLKDGSIFDSSKDREPLQFTIGSAQIIPGFEDGVIGLNVEEEKIINIPSEKAYGPHKKDLIKEVKKEQLAKDQIPKVGQILHATQSNGQKVPGRVVNITNEAIVIDFNHPLAGQDLIFDVKVVDIK